MCGLYGYITKKGTRLTDSQKEQRNGVLRGLALAMQERGTHSTGIACVSNKKVTILKKALSAQQLLNLPEFKNLMTLNNNIVIGHTRFATVGEKTDENAHPFEIGNIVGCHNGRITNYSSVYSEAKVDSEAIFYILDKYKNKFKPSFKKIRGSMALTWLNKKDINKVHIMVNDNPLFMIKIPEIDTYFWCSTIHGLVSVVGSHFNIKKNNIWIPKEDIVYEISTDFGKIKKTKIALQSLSEWYDSSKKVETVETAEVKLLSAPTEDDKKNATIIHNQQEIEEFMANQGLNNSACGYSHGKSINCDDDSDDDLLDGEIIKSKTILDNRDLMSDYRIIMNFSNKEMWQIVDSFNLQGCAFCDGDIDKNEGFLCLLTEKSLICMRCSENLTKKDYSDCVFIDLETFTDMTRELYAQR